jgi:hypothetical protein
VDGFRDVDYDRGQFWAEIKQMYFSVRDKIRTPQDRERNSEWGWFLSPDERARLESSVETFKVLDYIEELLGNRIDLSDKVKGEWLNCTAIMARCGKDNPNRGELNRVAGFLRKQGFASNRDKKFCVRIRDLGEDIKTAVDTRPKRLRLINPERD